MDNPRVTLTLGTLMREAGIVPPHALALRHAYLQEHEDSGMPGIHADSTDAEILQYTSSQSANPQRFPSAPPSLWAVFIREGGDRARLWSVVENKGEISNDGQHRVFDITPTEHLADLRNHLVVGWRAPRSWWIHASTADNYPVLEIADAEPERFPGFDQLVLDHVRLQAVMRENKYASWRTTLSSVVGIYLITDTRDGRQYVGKADGAENILQRWSAYAANGHGGNVELRGLDPRNFRYSLLRVFDPSTPRQLINAAESHFKTALDTRRHGLNRN